LRAGESENAATTFNRALGALELGRSINPLQRQHLLAVYQNALQNGGSEQGRLILQLSLDRLAIHQEQLDKPNLRPGEQPRDVLRDIQNMAQLQANGRYAVPPMSPGMTGMTRTPTFGGGGPGMPQGGPPGFMPGPGGPGLPGGLPPGGPVFPGGGRPAGNRSIPQ
jgi:hypothetical protein